MTNEDEVAKALLRLLAEIANKERRKAVESEEYFKAFIASVLEGYFKEAEKSIE